MKSILKSQTLAFVQLDQEFFAILDQFSYEN